MILQVGFWANTTLHHSFTNRFDMDNLVRWVVYVESLFKFWTLCWQCTLYFPEKLQSCLESTDWDVFDAAWWHNVIYSLLLANVHRRQTQWLCKIRSPKKCSALRSTKTSVRQKKINLCKLHYNNELQTQQQQQQQQQQQCGKQAPTTSLFSMATHNIWLTRH